MDITPIVNGEPFRLIRHTTSGFVSDVDPDVKSHLDELNGLLSKPIFAEIASLNGMEPAVERELQSVEYEPTPRPAGPPHFRPDIATLLSKKLTPKRTKGDLWDPDSLLASKELKEDPNPPELTLSDCIDKIPALSALKYAFQTSLSTGWLSLGFNDTKAVLEGYPAIADYLVAYAFFKGEVQEIYGLKNFILNNRDGAKNVARYATVSAARTVIDREKLEVPEFNVDDSAIVRAIGDAGLSLSSSSFGPALQAIIRSQIFDGRESKLIDDAVKAGMTIPVEMRPSLIKYIREFPVKITNDNAKIFLPLLISQLKGTVAIDDSGKVDTAESDKDFDVEPLKDDKSLIQISVSAVKCAAQLFYGMVLGDELDVFDTVNYFTHKYLVRGGIEIQDSRLREDLQMYVFSNRFTDLKTNKVLDRSRPAERKMFYRQVFDYGNAEVTEDLIVNKEFTKLWKVLMLESANYLERAQASPNPDSYVSKQKVMQAVEDLQYNLSTHCTGMANVITPLIYAELNFVINRIFMNKEVLKNVVPAGATWWRVVETLYMGMKNVRPKATVLYNKAMGGYDILRAIAEYDPATFQNNKEFSRFIATVDAFITTQSILQESLTDDLKKGDEGEQAGLREDRPKSPERPEVPVGTSPEARNGQAAGWDF